MPLLSDRVRFDRLIATGRRSTPTRRGRSGLGKPEVVVTLRVIGDDMADYLDIGSHFSLWSGSDVGRGVVTRRLLH